MKKTIYISGMSCAHCTARVEKALSAIDGVSAKADLNGGCAVVEYPESTELSALCEAVENLGFDVTGTE